MPEIRWILIVDDNSDHRIILSSILNSLGYDNIVTANNGEKALECLKQKSFDLIIADIFMPVISGIDLLKKVKDIAPKISFIICTAYGDANSYSEAMEQGAFEYLNKPIKKDMLRKVIRRI
jgi:DNA-binding NtrC family response regulator